MHHTHMCCEQALAKCRKLRKLFNKQCSALKKHAAYCTEHFGTVTCTKAGGAASCPEGQTLTTAADGKGSCSAPADHHRAPGATSDCIAWDQSWTWCRPGLWQPYRAATALVCNAAKCTLHE